MEVSSFDNRIVGQLRGLFKKTNGKNWGFFGEERERKNKNGEGSKMFSSSNMAQKSMTKREIK